ncbi:unnamed protein product [Caretta caretta]
MWYYAEWEEEGLENLLLNSSFCLPYPSLGGANGLPPFVFLFPSHVGMTAGLDAGKKDFFRMDGLLLHHLEHPATLSKLSSLSTLQEIAQHFTWSSHSTYILV